jgi:4-carboxymuconolactone decarboxylase
LARLEPLAVDKLTSEQKALHAQVSRGRPNIQGPYSVWLRTPPIAEAAHKLLTAVRQNGKLDKRLYELLVLTVTRHAGVEYAFAVHEPLALEAGIERAIVEAIRAKKQPSLTNPDDALIYEATTSLLQSVKLPDATYQALVKRFGVEVTIEFVTTVGTYCLIGTVLNAFEVPTPNGEKPFG